VFLVQVRPIVHGRAVRTAPATLFDFSRADPERIWRWDVTHNPDPLSPAQAALVHRESERTGLPMRSVGGYLYTAEKSVQPIELSTADELRRFFFDSVKPRAEAALREVEGTGPPSLREALAAYDAVFEVYARELGPRLEAARARVNPRALIGLPPLESVPTEIEWSAFAPVWDVAVPTYREVGLAHAHPNPPATSGREDVDPWAHAVRDISELDDRLFYRAQWAVRRALLARAEALGLRDPSDLFFADDPFAERLRSGLVAIEAEKNRAAFHEASRFHMPLAIQGGRALAEPWSRGADLWRGVGTGKTTVGSVYRFGQAASTPQKGAVVVAAALAPGALLMLRDVAAIVSEFDGLLGHTAALARELGIPCVVRCQGAWRDLSDGDRVFVDGQAGLVIRLA
jgi:pyruvate,water dikinase